MNLLALRTFSFWWYDGWGVKALAAMGRAEEAIAYAEAHLGINDDHFEAAKLCEEILLGQGRKAEAYRSYGYEANRGTTYLAIPSPRPDHSRPCWPRPPMSPSSPCGSTTPFPMPTR